MKWPNKESQFESQSTVYIPIFYDDNIDASTFQRKGKVWLERAERLKKGNYIWMYRAECGEEDRKREKDDVPQVHMMM